MPADPIPEWARRAAWLMAVVPEEDFEHVARELARVLGPEMARLERERDAAEEQARDWHRTADARSKALIEAMRERDEARAVLKLWDWSRGLAERARKARGEE